MARFDSSLSHKSINNLKPKKDMTTKNSGTEVQKMKVGAMFMGMVALALVNLMLMPGDELGMASWLGYMVVTKGSAAGLFAGAAMLGSKMWESSEEEEVVE